MSVGILDPAAMLDYATKNLRVEKLLIQVGLDPSNITYEAIFNRLLDIALPISRSRTCCSWLAGYF